MAQKWPFIARKGDGGFIPLQGSASKGAVGFIARYEHPNYGQTRRTHGTRWDRERQSTPVCAGAGHKKQQAPEKLHVIRLKEVSTNAENVAIPTRRIQDLKQS